jgi:hypothetical protein
VWLFDQAWWAYFLAKNFHHRALICKQIICIVPRSITKLDSAEQNNGSSYNQEIT